MKVFLVRHGRTKESESNRRQYPYSLLSEKGVLQAKAAAIRLNKESLDMILSSEWIRAKETAEIISTEIGKPFKIISGIQEKEHSPALHGITLDDEIQKEYEKDLKNNWGDLDWKFRGEGESLRDIIQRAGKFIELIVDDYRGKNILVVTHSAFIRGFIVSAILGDKYCDSDCLNLFLGINIANTGISLLEFNETRKSWGIVYLNDHLHLEE